MQQRDVVVDSERVVIWVHEDLVDAVVLEARRRLVLVVAPFSFEIQYAVA